MSLQIKILGSAGEGKSTLATLVQKLLGEQGFNVSLLDDDGTDEEYVMSEEVLAARIASIKSRNGVIAIETLQLRK